MADMRRGEIRWADLGDSPQAGEAAYRRPVLIISNDRLSPNAPVIVIPLTTTPRHYPTIIELEDTLPRPSYLQCEQIRALSRRRIGDWIATVDGIILSHVNLVVRRLLDLD